MSYIIRKAEVTLEPVSTPRFLFSGEKFGLSSMTVQVSVMALMVLMVLVVLVVLVVLLLDDLWKLLALAERSKRVHTPVVLEEPAGWAAQPEQAPPIVAQLELVC